MRAIVQRVRSCEVKVEGESVGRIGHGLLTLLGIAVHDTPESLDWMIRKIVNLRIFEDESGKMNRSLIEAGGEHLIVSQFTLYGDCRKGNRPSFIEAARPEEARRLYDEALQLSRSLGIITAGGRFQAHMEVQLVNDGPVTLSLESPPNRRP